MLFVKMRWNACGLSLRKECHFAFSSGCIEMSFPRLPALNILTERSLDDVRERILTLRNEIIRLRHEEHKSTGEMKEHYKYVIADHCWKLGQCIGEFWRGACKEISELENPVQQEPRITPATIMTFTTANDYFTSIRQ